MDEGISNPTDEENIRNFTNLFTNHQETYLNYKNRSEGINKETSKRSKKSKARKNKLEKLLKELVKNMAKMCLKAKKYFLPNPITNIPYC